MRQSVQLTKTVPHNNGQTHFRQGGRAKHDNSIQYSDCNKDLRTPGGGGRRGEHLDTKTGWLDIICSDVATRGYSFNLNLEVAI